MPNAIQDLGMPRSQIKIYVTTYTDIRIHTYTKTHTYIGIYTCTYMQIKIMNRRTVCYFSVSDHQVNLETEECCSKRRVCHLNDQMEQL